MSLASLPAFERRNLWSGFLNAPENVSSTDRGWECASTITIDGGLQNAVHYGKRQLASEDQREHKITDEWVPRRRFSRKIVHLTLLKEILSPYWDSFLLLITRLTCRIK